MAGRSYLLFLRHPVGTQILGHELVDPVGKLYGGQAFVFLGVDDGQQPQIHGAGPKVKEIVQHQRNIPHGADHDGHLGLGGDLEDAGTEVVQLLVGLDVAFREDGDGHLVLLDELDALENGLQSLPVIFPVDGLAQQLMHDLAHQEHGAGLPLGDECQLTFGEECTQRHRIQVMDVIAYQQESALLWFQYN